MEFGGVRIVETQPAEDFSPGLNTEAGEVRIRLETRLSNYVGAEFCALFSGGTAGMLAALRAAGVGDGDTVVCTAFSYLSIPEIIAAAGAKPYYADINPNTFNLDPYCLDYAIKKCARSDSPPPKAVVASDMFGLCCDYGELADICARYGITLIEDMSCAFGASYRGRKAGSFGRFAVASFYPSRPFGDEGEGGGVFCHSKDDLRALEQLRIGKDAETPAASFVRTSLLGEKLGQYAKELSRRQLVAARYRENLRAAVKTQQIPEDYIHACTQFAIAAENEDARDRIAESLKEARVPCGKVAACVPGSLKGGKKNSRTLPANTLDLSKRLLTIPIHPHLSFRVADYISEAILRIVEEREL